jgi:hypothetical protein
MYYLCYEKHSHHQEEMMEILVDFCKKASLKTLKKVAPAALYLLVLLFPRAAQWLIPFITKWTFNGKLPKFLFPIKGELLFFGKDGNIFFDTRRVSLEEDPEKENSFKTFFEQAINLPSYGENAQHLGYNPSWFWLHDAQYSVERAGVKICIVISYNFRITNQTLVSLVQTTGDLFAEPISFSKRKAAEKAAHLRLPHAHFFTEITTLYGNVIRFKMRFNKQVHFGKVADVLERLEPNTDFEWDTRIDERCVIFEQVERMEHEIIRFMIDGESFAGRCALPQYPPRTDWRWCKRYKMMRCTLASRQKERFAQTLAKLNHAHSTTSNHHFPTQPKESIQMGSLVAGARAQKLAQSLELPHSRYFSEICVTNGIPREFILKFDKGVNYTFVAEILSKIPWSDHCFWDTELSTDGCAIHLSEKRIKKLNYATFGINDVKFIGAYGIPSFPPKEEWTYSEEAQMWHTTISHPGKEHLAHEIAELCCALPENVARDQPVEQQISIWRNHYDHVLAPH